MKSLIGNAQNCILSIALVVIAFFQFSCDSLVNESVLYRVMRTSKFRVTKINATQPARLGRLDVLFLWDLRRGLGEEDIEEIHGFVKDGGTLIASGENEALDLLLLDYGLEIRRASNPLRVSRRIPTESIFQYRPVDEIYSSTNYAIHPTVRDIAPLYGQGTDYSVVTFHEGEGRAYFFSCPDIFTKHGLRDDRNAAFLYNLMTTFPRRARVGLAQKYYYAAGSASEADPLTYLLFNTSGGLGVVYIGAIVFLFLILRGRRFGMPLTLEDTHRRVSSEYVHAMTALYQKGDTRRAVLKQIRDAFRSNLAARWHINPNLETADFVDEIARRKPIDTEELQTLLAELEPRSDVSEARLLSLAKQVEAYCDRAKIRRTRPTHR